MYALIRAVRRSWFQRVLGVSGLLAACTLTNDEFKPETVLRQNVPDGGGAAGAPGEPGNAACTAPGCCEQNSDCGDGESCVAGICTASTCDGAEDIASCLLAYCPGPSCPTTPVDVAPTCADGEKNGAESSVDCGQSCPVRCAADAECLQDTDCASFNCNAGLCVAASCSDGITNQDESDIDCGGSCPVACAAGSDCNESDDCGPDLFCPAASRVCSSNSCQDGAQSGTEILADCGGGGCPGCPAGTPCSVEADCASGICGPDGECTEAACDDGRQNQDETDADCGGSCEASCANGSPCNDVSDCQSGVCNAGGCEPGTETCCQAPTCNDGVRNGNEPAVDCGSVQACGLCTVGEACTANGQCQTGICRATCQPRPLCADNILSGNESDVDCGGNDPACARCADRDSCRVDADCASGDCAGNLCISCSDGVRNGTETDTDCGGNNPSCGRCPDGDSCTATSDCATSPCNRGICTDVSCSDNITNGTETGVDCGGSDPTCRRCPDGTACALASDCSSNNCLGSRCISCGDGALNGTETDLDCGGADPACSRCAPGRECRIDSDCGSGACEDGRCCGGTLRDCTRCAQRLSPTIDCNSPGTDSTGVANCGAFLQCLQDNALACPTRTTPGCSGDNQATDACPHNDFGGNAGTGVTRANQVLVNAGCQL